MNVARWIVPVAMLGALASAAPPESAASTSMLARAKAMHAECAAPPGRKGCSRLLLEAGRLHESLKKWSRCRSSNSDGCARDEKLRRIEEYDSNAQATPACFTYGTVSGEFYYNGCHYRWLLERYPAAPEVTEAAFSLAMMPELYDCEDGRTAAACVIKGHLAPALPFFGKVATSSRAAELVAHLDEIVLGAARAAAAEKAKGIAVDIRAVFDQLDSYARASEALQPKEAAVAWDAIAESALVLGDPARAVKWSEKVVSSGTGGEVAQRARARLSEVKNSVGRPPGP